MKKLLAILLTTVLMFSVISTDAFVLNVNAATSGITGDCTWELDGTVLTISGNGEMGDYSYDDSSGYSTAPYMVCDFDEVIIAEGVTHIGDWAFGRCSNLTSVEIPNSITSIGENAFNDCSALEYVDIPYGIERIEAATFAGCSSLKEIVLPSTLKYIYDGAFSGCSRLQDFDMPSSVKSIGKFAFFGCHELTHIAFSEDLSYLDSHIFAECDSLKKLVFTGDAPNLRYEVSNPLGTDYVIVYYPADNDTWTEEYREKWDDVYFWVESPADNKCGESATWTLSDEGVLTISGEGDVQDFSQLYGMPWMEYLDEITSLVVEEGITSIGNYSLQNADSLKSVLLPNTVTKIGQDAFNSCDVLENVTLSNGESSSMTNAETSNNAMNIGTRAFSGCVSLKTVEIPYGVTSIEHSAFNYCCSLTSIKIPNSVTNIGTWAFRHCCSLEKIEIPKSVTSIGNGAFNECRSLAHINIPNGVAYIDSSTFYGCSSLVSIEIPNSITYIGSTAFSGCNSLAYIGYQGTETEKSKIRMSEAWEGGSNKALIEAVWYYNICPTEHAYCHDCDVTCEQCDWPRETSEEHAFSLNENMTCENCGFSMRPDIPQLESKTNNSVTLVANSIYEYSNDGETWQDGNIFTGLLGNKEYTFYQRVKASVYGQTSEKSEGLVIFLKDVQEAPNTPSVLSYTDTMAILSPISNGEYSCDGISWQTSNVFENLSPGTKYTFYQRYAETDTHLASEASSGISVTTDKSKQTFIPDMPIAQSITSSSITLVIVEGCEYSKNGTTWQTSNLFNNLSCGTEYTFYQRYKETSTTYVGEKSVPLIVKTDKGTQSLPTQPTLISKTYDTVTLTFFNGYEYSIDGINWKTSNVFVGLNPNTDYLFYQRKMETDTHYASPMSSSLEVRTNEKPTYRVGDLDGDSELTDWDGVMLARYLAGWQVDIATLEALDIDNDGEITDWDGVILDRYLAGWNIQIGGE